MALEAYNLDTLSALQDDRGQAKHRYTLNIDLQTTGDFKTKKYDPLPFSPNMVVSKDLYPSNRLYFAPVVAYTMDDIIAVAGKNNDYRAVLANRDKYTALIRRALDEPNRKRVKRTDVERQTPAFLDIIKADAQIAQELFFPVNGLLYVLGKPYIIRNSSINWSTLRMSRQKDASGDDSTTKKKSVSPLPEIFQLTFNLILLRTTPDQIKNDKLVGDFKTKGKTCYERSLELEAQLSQLLKGTKLKISNLIDKSADMLSQEKNAQLVKTPHMNVLQTDWQGRNAARKSDFYISEKNRARAASKIYEVLMRLEALDELLAEIPSDYLNVLQPLREELKNVKQQSQYIQATLDMYKAKRQQTETDKYYQQELQKLLRALELKTISVTNEINAAHKESKAVSATRTSTTPSNKLDLKIKIQKLENELRNQTLTNPTKADDIAEQLQTLYAQQAALNQDKSISTDSLVSEEEQKIRARKQVEVLRSLKGKDKYKAILDQIEKEEDNLNRMKFERLFTTEDAATVKKKLLQDVREVYKELQKINYNLKWLNRTDPQYQTDKKHLKDLTDTYIKKINELRDIILSYSTASEKETWEDVLKANGFPKDEDSLIKAIDERRSYYGGRRKRTQRHRPYRAKHTRKRYRKKWKLSNVAFHESNFVFLTSYNVLG